MLGLGNILTKGGAVLGFPNKYSFNFDGDNDYLDCGADVHDFSSGDFTILGWVYHDTGNTDHAGIVGIRSGGSTEVQFYIRAGGGDDDKLASWNGTNNVYSTSTISNNTWTHVGLVQSGSDKKFYINGALDNTASQGHGSADSSSFKIGYTGNGNEYFKGKIDEVGVWNVALSADDIAKIASKPVDFSKASSYATDRTSNLKLWLRAGDKVLPEEDTSIARSDFYTDFDGTDDNVTFDSSSLPNLTPYTITAWFKSTDIDQAQAIVLWGDQTAYERRAMIIFNGTDGGSDWTLVASINGENPQGSTTLVENQIYHGAVVVNPSTKAYKIYLDGKLDGSGTFSNTLASWSGGTGFIGRSHYGEYFEGNIYSASVYQTELDAQTIKQFAKSRFTPMRDNRFSVVDFDGTNDHIVVSDNSALDFGTGDFTVALWHKSDAQHDQPFINKKTTFSDNTAGWTIYMENGNDQMRCRIAGGSSNVAVSAGTKSVSDNNWHFTTMVRSGDNLYLYTDGVLEGSTTGVNSLDVDNSDDLYIGRGGSLYPQISVSSVSLYNVAKSAEEVYAIYQKGITYDESSLSGLVGYWRMGDDTSKAYPTIADSSSNSNDGTITNGASNDIVQQMVAGWDMGAFESSSEELGGSLITNPNSVSTYSGNQTIRDEVTVDGRSGVRAEETNTSDRGRMDIVGLGIENNVPYQFSGYVYKYSSYNGNSATDKNWHFAIGTETTHSTYPDVSSDTVQMGVSSYDTWEYFTVNIIARSGTKFELYPSKRLNVDIGTMIFSDLALKKVLQSEVSDTYPAIIDVNEPVLGLDLITNGDLESSSSSPTMNSVAFTYYNGSGARSTDFSNGGSHSYKFTGGDQNDHNAKIIPNDSSLVGKILSVSVDVYTPTSGGSSGNIDLRVINHSGSASTLESTSTKDAWVNLSGVFVYDGTSAQPINIQWFTADSVMYIDNLSIKQILGNVGTMTNQAADDLVYSSVLPDQSYLTGVNSAYNFFDNDATNEYIDCGTGIGTFLGDNYAGDLSISIWFKNAGANDDGLFDMGAGTGSGKLYISVGYLSKLFFNLNNGNWSRSVSFTDTSDWHHLIIVYKGGSESESLMYLDNSSVGATAGTFPSASDMDFGTNNKVAIGTFWDRSAYAFDGSIGQTAIWNKALSATEVSAIYTLGRHGNLLDSYADNLLGYWAMGALDASTGLSDVGDGTIYDRSGNSNHGTATNTEAADLASSPNAEPNGYAKGDTNRSTTTP
jgi:hypothetical protein